MVGRRLKLDISRKQQNIKICDRELLHNIPEASHPMSLAWYVLPVSAVNICQRFGRKNSTEQRSIY